MLSTLAASLLSLCFVACSSDEPSVSSEPETLVSFAVSLPADLQTRSTFGDGSQTTINAIEYAVFKVTGDNNETETFLYSATKSETVTDINDNIIIEIPMVKNFKYRVAFFAKNSANSKVTHSQGVLTVSYTGVAPNEANADVFAAESGVITVEEKTAMTDYHQIKLKRPFAQLNWGTAGVPELKESYGDNFDLKATVSISDGLYTQYNILRDAVVESSKVSSAVSFSTVDCNALPEMDFPVTVEGKKYDLVAMNYILVGKGDGAETGTINCSVTFNWTDDGTAQTRTTEVNSAPCKANCRTNIYGDLITTPTTFQCIIQTAFDESENNITL